jgi:hypothetical protein
MAQGNLVPNFSFEINAGCPTGNGQFYLVADWVNPTNGSPEYYNSCFPSTNGYGVPNNIAGEQSAHSGNAYAGIVMWEGPYREYLQTQLLDSLCQGEIYCVQFYVSLPGKAEYATITPQVLFSDLPVISSTPWFLPLSPQIFDTVTILNDTTNWMLVSGEYVANGGETYITIGNFYDDAHTPIDSISNSTVLAAYYYLDDVFIYKKANANAGLNTTICLGDSVQIGETNLEIGISYNWSPSIGLADSSSHNPWTKPLITTTYILSITDTLGLYCPGNPIDSVTITVNDCTPLPQYNVPTLLEAGEMFFISALPENTALQLFDARGRLVYRDENYLNNFSTSNLAIGIYVYKLNTADGNFQTGKICIVK